MNAVKDIKQTFFESHTQKIKECVANIADDFYHIGFYLREVKMFEYYRGGGYESFVEYAEKELGFKKSAAYNLIRICEKFGARQGNSLKYWIDPKYKDYNSGQLCEMLSLSPAKQEIVTPDMTVKEIRELKKIEKEVNEVKEEKFQTSGNLKKENSVSAPDEISSNDNKLLMKIDFLNERVKHMEEFQKGLYDLLNEIDKNFNKITKKQMRNSISDFIGTGEITFSEE